MFVKLHNRLVVKKVDTRPLFLFASFVFYDFLVNSKSEIECKGLYKRSIYN